MENAQYVAAVDLGTTKVVIAVGRRAEKGKVEIVALKEAPSLGIIKGDLKNIEQASHALKEVKQKIEEQLGITISEAYVGISGQHIRCNNTSGYVFVQTSDREVSEVSAADVKRLKDEQRNSSTQLGQTIIEVIPQSYKLDEDSEITEPVGMEGKRLEAKFNIIVGEEAAIERIGRCFNRVGLTLAGIKLQPLASAKAVLSDDEKELGVVVVDIGGGTTDVCIYHDKTIRHLAVIPFGGNVINRDIKADGILERHVEKLKTTFGEAISAQAAAEKFINIPSVSGQAAKEVGVKRLAGIIEARMSEIIDFVMFEIERRGSKGKLGAGF
ncbi:MAG: cell division protein FtsA, partial [Mucinivorans sp.]